MGFQFKMVALVRISLKQRRLSADEEFGRKKPETRAATKRWDWTRPCLSLREDPGPTPKHLLRSEHIPFTPQSGASGCVPLELLL